MKIVLNKFYIVLFSLLLHSCGIGVEQLSCKTKGNETIFVQVNSSQFNYKFSTWKKKPVKLKIIYKDKSKLVGHEYYQDKLLAKLTYYKKNKVIIYSLPRSNFSRTFKCRKQGYG